MTQRNNSKIPSRDHRHSNYQYRNNHKDNRRESHGHRSGHRYGNDHRDNRRESHGYRSKHRFRHNHKENPHRQRSRSRSNHYDRSRDKEHRRNRDRSVSRNRNNRMYREMYRQEQNESEESKLIKKMIGAGNLSNADKELFHKMLQTYNTLLSKQKKKEYKQTLEDMIITAQRRSATKKDGILIEYPNDKTRITHITDRDLLILKQFADRKEVQGLNKKGLELLQPILKKIFIDSRDFEFS